MWRWRWSAPALAFGITVLLLAAFSRSVRHVDAEMPPIENPGEMGKH